MPIYQRLDQSTSLSTVQHIGGITHAIDGRELFVTKASGETGGALQMS